MSYASFEKSHRLRKACDFAHLKSGSKTLSRPWIRAFFKSTAVDSSQTRIGFAVSKKVGKANRRNRLKRLMRDSFRCSEHKFLSTDILVVVSPNLFKKVSDNDRAERYLLNSFQELMNEVKCASLNE
ncbi:MAG: ribonuclease P protein component [Bacteriovoracaceae bacterium]|nr:ribonuclease P protein component [Bacteriovoracaceae bacterium]